MHKAWRVLAALLVTAAAQTEAPLHPVDVREAVCPGQAGVVNISGLWAGNVSSKPLILSLYRTSPREVNLSLTLVDAGGYVVAQELEVTLLHIPTEADLTSTTAAPGADEPAERRLAAAAAWPGGEETFSCEEVFLADGRPPVELPETWAEARAAFRDVCHFEGSSPEECRRAEDAAFEGLPADASAMDADEELCARLLQSISALHMVEVGNATLPLTQLTMANGQPYKLGRRLKGAGRSVTSGGSPAASSGFSSARAGGANFGYSQAGMSRSFAGSPARTSYGYSGMSSYGYRGANVRTAAIAGGVGGFMFWRMRAGGGGYHRRGDRDQQCTDSEDCEFTPPEAMYRDDLMMTGFYGEEYDYPLHVVIGNLSGVDYDPSSICPPPGWSGFPEGQALDINTTNASWLFGLTDLWAQLNTMEEIDTVWEEEEGPGAGLWAVIGIIACICFCACACKCLGRRKETNSGPPQFQYNGSVTVSRPSQNGGVPQGHVVGVPVNQCQVGKPAQNLKAFAAS